MPDGMPELTEPTWQAILLPDLAAATNAQVDHRALDHCSRGAGPCNRRRSGGVADLHSADS
jgi:hypothetical protein